MNIAYSTLHFQSVTNFFNEQFRNEELLDCTLNAEGGSIKVHKAILCAQSTLLEVPFDKRYNPSFVIFLTLH